MLLVPVTTIGIGIEFCLSVAMNDLDVSKDQDLWCIPDQAQSDDVFLNAKRDLRRRV